VATLERDEVHVGYTSGHSESTSLFYTAMYSDDGGKSWKYVQDDAAAQPGSRPSGSHRMTTTSYTLPTPANKFPKGSYLLRVEGHRTDIVLHYAYHQQKIYVKR